MPLTPNNREEHWLQGMVDGQTTLEPNKRREYWYKEIVDAIGSGGGGGGGGGGVLVVNQTYDEALEANVLDKTWKEINESPFAVIVESGPFGLFRSFVFATSSTPTYALSSVTFVGNEPSYIVFTASTENDYPVSTS